MPKLIRTGFGTLKSTLVIGILMVVPVGALIAQSVATYSSPDTKVCVTAAWASNPNIISYYGDCPELLPFPIPNPTFQETSLASPTASPTPTAVVTPTKEATQPDISIPSESPEPSSTPTKEPVPTSSPTPTVTAVPTPTHSPDVTVSPTPTATAPVVPPEPDPIPIPPENTDPKTSEFMFCHGGAMHSNSYTGMLNGHHDKHPDDIIPPIPFKFYGGWNWNATNAKTFYNNCVPVK